MQMEVAICDDEQIVCSEIKKLIEEIQPDWNISIYYSGKSLLENINNECLLFLDIEMPEIDGMKVAEQLRNENNDIEIIFLTSHEELMPDAFKVKAFRFLSKPIAEDKFREALMGAQEEIINNNKIAITNHAKQEIISIRDIVYIEAFGDGTYIHMKSKVIESTLTLKYWEEKLIGQNFYKVHRTYLVSLRYISSIEKNGIRFAGIKDEVPVARRKLIKLREEVIEFTKKYSRIV